MKTIALTQGKTALVDDEDFERVRIIKWQAFYCHKTWYAVGAYKGVRFKLHRFLLGVTDPLVLVDHKDRNGLNNQKENLRVASLAQNGANTGPYSTNKSGYKGVSWHKRFRYWEAKIGDRPKTHIGSFPTAEEAARAYDAKARELYGEFAWLNFPMADIIVAELGDANRSS